MKMTTATSFTNQLRMGTDNFKTTVLGARKRPVDSNSGRRYPRRRSCQDNVTMAALITSVLMIPILSVILYANFGANHAYATGINTTTTNNSSISSRLNLIRRDTLASTGQSNGSNPMQTTAVTIIDHQHQPGRSDDDSAVTTQASQSSAKSSQLPQIIKDLAKLNDTQRAKLLLNSTTVANGQMVPPMENLTDMEADEDDRSLILSLEIANSIIFVIGLCGNTIVILVILKFTKIETVTDIYILNLAFADLMFIFGLVFLITTMHIDHWIFGNLMCKLYMATTSLNQFASSLLLVVMSFDRFLAVCHPIYAQRFRRLRRAKIICLCIWITCLILMTPIFVFAKTNKDLTCAIFWPEYKSFNCEIAFTLYSFAIGFAVPLLLIAAFYICVIRKLRLAARRGPVGLGSTRRSKSRESTNRRIEHLVIGIICTYTICWLPYWITQLCVSFTTHYERAPVEGFYQFFMIATSLSYTNSALNPILYAFLSDNFKRRCSDIVRSIYSIKWCQQSQCTESHSTVITAYYESEPSRPESRQQQQLLSYNQQHQLQQTATTILDETDNLIPNNSQSVNNINSNNNNSKIGNNSNSNSNGNKGSNSNTLSDNQNISRLTNLARKALDQIGICGGGGGGGMDRQHNYLVETSGSSGRNITKTNRSNKEIVDRTNSICTNNNNSIVANNCQHHPGTDNRNRSSADLNINLEVFGDSSLSNNNNNRKKSVNFSVDTIVVQELKNNETTVKSNHHKILQVDNNNRHHAI